MSATDELRRLLDERRVECWDMKTRGVWFGISGREHRFEAYEQTDGLIELSIYDLTPEQAVEATLGRGTCEVVSSIRHDYEGGYGGTEYEHELSCGHKTWWADDDPPEWCPYCGRKVVDA